MTLAPFDYFLAFLLTFGLALWAHREHARLENRLARGYGSARIAGYRRIVVMQWSLIGLLGIHWIWTAREVSALGLASPLHWRFVAGMGISLAATAFFWTQLRKVRRSEEARAEARDELASLKTLLPHSPRELEAFMRVSVTAGICEELLYRGFLAWFLATWMPFWLAMIVSGVIFGFGHLYQGAVGVAKTGALGILLGGLTLLSGSILPAMVVHVAIDALNGQLAYVALTTPVPVAEEPVEDLESPEEESASQL
jgi:membrane protease YdiL (CAAX protease family)